MPKEAGMYRLYGTILGAIATGILLLTTFVPKKANVQQFVITPKALITFYSAPAKEFDLKGYDQYRCLHFTPDLEQCLDKSNKPVQKVWNVSSLPKPVDLKISSQDVGNNTFRVTIEDKSFDAPNGECVIADTYTEQVLNGLHYQTHIKFTICYLNGIWFFRFRY